MIEKIKFFEDALNRMNHIHQMQDAEEKHKEYHDFYNSLDGWKYELFNKYKDAKLRGNQFIDFNDLPDPKEVLRLIDCLKECGVECITVSSSWSLLVSRMWLFHQNGYEIAGMIEINRKSKDPETNKHNKEPAFLLIKKK